jgi:hypothetical protein
MRHFRKNAEEYALVEEHLTPATLYVGGESTTPITAFELLRSIGMLRHNIPRKIEFSGENFHSTQVSFVK